MLRHWPGPDDSLMERLTTFVSSRGLLKACGAHNNKPTSSAGHIAPELLASHVPGGSIYVCTHALANFAEHFLPRLREPFVLVSGDSDLPISPQSLGHPAIKAILSSEYLLDWFAQNLSADHPKLRPLPIGLDYHTMWETPGFWGLTAVSPISQEHSLLATLASSPPFSQRYLVGYCNWHFALQRGDRTECRAKVDKSICYFEAKPVPRSSTWVRQAECMFVVSPQGAGMDCHRTWEAIMLGCIPVLKRNALAPLLDGLPALVVDDWQQVNRETLVDYASRVQTMKFDFSPLFRDSWARKIARLPARDFPAMTLQEFRSCLTRVTG